MGIKPLYYYIDDKKKKKKCIDVYTIIFTPGMFKDETFYQKLTNSHQEYQPFIKNNLEIIILGH